MSTWVSVLRLLALPGADISAYCSALVTCTYYTRGTFIRKYINTNIFIHKALLQTTKYQCLQSTCITWNKHLSASTYQKNNTNCIEQEGVTLNTSNLTVLCGHKVRPKSDTSTAKDSNNQLLCTLKHTFEIQREATKFCCYRHEARSLSDTNNSANQPTNHPANLWYIPMDVWVEEQR